MQIQQHSRWVTELLVELFLSGLTLQTLDGGLFLAHACAENKCKNSFYYAFNFLLLRNCSYFHSATQYKHRSSQI